MAVRITRAIDIPHNDGPIVERGQIIRQEGVITRQQSQVSYTRSVSTSSKTVKTVNGRIVDGDEEFSPTHTVVETHESNSSHHNEEHESTNIVYSKSPSITKSQLALEGNPSTQGAITTFTNGNSASGIGHVGGTGYSFSQTRGSEKITKKITKTQVIKKGKAVSPTDQQHQIMFSESSQFKADGPQLEQQPTEIQTNYYYKAGNGQGTTSFPKGDDHNQIVASDTIRPEKGGVTIVRGTSSQTSSTTRKRYTSSKVETTRSSRMISNDSKENDFNSRTKMTLPDGQEPNQHHIKGYKSSGDVEDLSKTTNKQSLSSVTVSKRLRQETRSQSSTVSTRSEIKQEQPSIKTDSIQYLEYKISENDKPQIDNEINYKAGQQIRISMPTKDIMQNNTAQNAQVIPKIFKEYHPHSSTHQESRDAKHTDVKCTGNVVKSQSTTFNQKKIAATERIQTKTKEQEIEIQNNENKTSQQAFSYSLQYQNDTRNRQTIDKEHLVLEQDRIIYRRNDNNTKNEKPKASKLQPIDFKTQSTVKLHEKQKDRDDDKNISNNFKTEKVQNTSQFTDNSVIKSKVIEVKRQNRNLIEQHKMEKPEISKKIQNRLVIHEVADKEVDKREIQHPKRTLIPEFITKEILERDQEPERPKDKPKRLKIPEFTTKEVVKQEEVVQVQRLNTTLFENREEPEEPLEKRETPRVKKLNMPDFATKEVPKSEVIEVKKLDRTLFEQKPTEEEPDRPKDKPKRLKIPEFTTKEVVRQEEVVPVQRLDTSLFDSPEQPDGPEPKREPPSVNKLKMPEFTTKEVTKSEVTEVRRLDRTILERQQPEEPEPVKREPVRTRKLRTEFVTTFQNEEPQESLPQQDKEKPKKLKIPEFTTKEVVKQEEVVQVQRLNTTLFENREEPEEPLEKREVPRVKKLNIPNYATKEVRKSEVIEVKKLDQTRFEEKPREEKFEMPKEMVNKRVIPEFSTKQVGKPKMKEVIRMDRNFTKDDEPFRKEPVHTHNQKDEEKPKKLKIPEFQSAEVVKHDDVVNSQRWKKGSSRRSEDEEVQIHLNMRNKGVYQSGTSEKKGNLSVIKETTEIVNGAQHKDVKRISKDFPEKREASIVDFKVMQNKDQNSLLEVGNEEQPGFDIGKQRFMQVDKSGTAFVGVRPQRKDTGKIDKEPRAGFKWDVIDSQKQPTKPFSNTTMTQSSSRGVDVTVHQIDIPIDVNESSSKWNVKRSLHTTQSTDKAQRGPHIDITVRQNQKGQVSKWDTQTPQKTVQKTVSKTEMERDGPPNFGVTVRQIGLSEQDNQQGYKRIVRTHNETQEMKRRGPGHVDVSLRQIDFPEQISQRGYKWTVQTSTKKVQPSTNKVQSGPERGDLNVLKGNSFNVQSQQSYNSGGENSQQTSHTKFSTRQIEQNRNPREDVIIRQTDFSQQRSEPGYKWAVESTTDKNESGLRTSDVAIRKLDSTQDQNQHDYIWSSQKTTVSTTDKENKGQHNIGFNVRQVDLPQDQSQKLGFERSRQTTHKTYSSTQNKQTKGADAKVHRIDTSYQSNQRSNLQNQGIAYIDVDTQHLEDHTFTDDLRTRQTEQIQSSGPGSSYAQVRKESKKIISGSPGDGIKVHQMEVQRQQSPSSGSSWQVQSVRGVKQGQWEQTHTSEITGDQGQKITRHSYQAQHSSSSHQQSFYHSSQNSGAIQFRTHETEPNFPALMQKDGKWEVRRVSVDDNTRYAPQTSMEVQPLERKVTLGATDKNAPQRKELMKEFKQKAQTKTYEDVLEDGTHVKRIIQTSGGTTYDEPGSQTRVHSVREHVVMSKRY